MKHINYLSERLNFFKSFRVYDIYRSIWDLNHVHNIAKTRSNYYHTTKHDGYTFEKIGYTYEIIKDSNVFRILDIIKKYSFDNIIVKRKISVITINEGHFHESDPIVEYLKFYNGELISYYTVSLDGSLIDNFSILCSGKFVTKDGRIYTLSNNKLKHVKSSKLNISEMYKRRKEREELQRKKDEERRIKQQEEQRKRDEERRIKQQEEQRKRDEERRIQQIENDTKLKIAINETKININNVIANVDMDIINNKLNDIHHRSYLPITKDISQILKIVGISNLDYIYLCMRLTRLRNGDIAICDNPDAIYNFKQRSFLYYTEIITSRTIPIEIKIHIVNEDNGYFIKCKRIAKFKTITERTCKLTIYGEWRHGKYLHDKERIEYDYVDCTLREIVESGSFLKDKETDNQRAIYIEKLKRIRKQVGSYVDNVSKHNNQLYCRCCSENGTTQHYIDDILNKPFASEMEYLNECKHREYDAFVHEYPELFVN